MKLIFITFNKYMYVENMTNGKEITTGEKKIYDYMLVTPIITL